MEGRLSPVIILYGLKIPIIFILCPQDEQKTTAKSTLHFLDTEAKQAMFKAFQNLGRIEPQFDAADPRKRVYQFAVAPFVKVRSDVQYTYSSFGFQYDG